MKYEKNPKRDNHQRSFKQILARKILPVGALGLLGIGILGHYFAEMTAALKGLSKTYVTLISIVIFELNPLCWTENFNIGGSFLWLNLVKILN